MGYFTGMLTFRSSSRNRQVLTRWRVGHQVFITLDQLLITTIVALERALSERDWERAERCFRDVANLLLASTATLRFTGDFGRGEYERYAVLDMVRFYAAPGMSGSNMTEHRLLVRLLRTTVRGHVETIRTAPPRVWDAYQQFSHARATALDAHRHVCEWSAGNRKSLASRTEEPAGEKLERMAAKERADLAVTPARELWPPGEVPPTYRDALDDVIHVPSRCPASRLYAALSGFCKRILTHR